MSNRRVRCAIAFAAVLLAAPVSAQSKWEVQYPLILGLAQSGMLVTIAPPTFTGCQDAALWVGLPGLPKLDLWSVVYVDDPGAPVLDARWVFTPFGALNILQTTDVWLRVFPVEGMADLEEWQATPCAFYESHAYVAEGLGRINYHSADDSLNGPGVNTWGWTISGNLHDAGYCAEGRSPRLFWVNHWVVRSSTDLSSARSTSAKGPELTCR